MSKDTLKVGDENTNTPPNLKMFSPQSYISFRISVQIVSVFEDTWQSVPLLSSGNLISGPTGGFLKPLSANRNMKNSI